MAVLRRNHHDHVVTCADLLITTRPRACQRPWLIRSHNQGVLPLLSDAIEAVWLLITEPLRRLFADAFYEALTRAEEDRQAAGDGEALHWGETKTGGGQIDEPRIIAPSWMSSTSETGSDPDR